MAWLTHFARPELDKRDLGQLRALAAAALHDVAGLSQAQVAEWLDPDTTIQDRLTLMSGRASHDGTRVARRQVKRGRELWIKLAAWPWWAIVGDGGSLKGGMPDEWWNLPLVRATYATWIGVHPLRPGSRLG